MGVCVVRGRSRAPAPQKSINGVVNKVNASNLAQLAPLLFRENLIRGRGLLCRCGAACVCACVCACG